MKKAVSLSAIVLGHIEHFWFERVSAAGFGLMRIAFGATAFLTLLLEYGNISRYYGPTGIFPREAVSHLLRNSWRFSLLDYVGDTTTHVLVIILLVALLCVTLGIATKRALFVAIVLLFSFHEYAQYLLDGGDTLQRIIGFILLLSPCDRAFSLENLRRRIKIGKATGKDQEPSERTMPIWPYRLLLWQMILLYASAGIEKWSGTTWKTGSAVAIGLHHAHFTRLSPALADMLSYASPAIGYFTLFSQSAWILLLIAPFFIWLGVLPKNFHGSLKRALLLCGVFVHAGIFLLMDVGTFSFIVFASYLGLLLDDDFRAMRRRLVGKNQKSVIVLFDGRCGFCSASVVVLRSFDWLHRLTFANLHDADARKKYASKTSLETLKKAMHVRNAKGELSQGFFAFRSLSHVLPPLWPLLPLLYIPGVSVVGERVYGWVAGRREKFVSGS